MFVSKRLNRESNVNKPVSNLLDRYYWLLLFGLNRENPPVFTFLLQNQKRLYQRSQRLILQTVLTCLISMEQAQRWQHRVETQHIKGNVAAAYMCMPQDIMLSAAKGNCHRVYLQGRKREKSQLHLPSVSVYHWQHQCSPAPSARVTDSG